MGRGLDGFFVPSRLQTRRVVPRLRAAVFKSRRRALAISGGYGEGETPLPIPNRAVKPLSADGTWPARARESRSPPVYFIARAVPRGGSSCFGAAPGRRASGSARPAAPLHRAGASRVGNAAARGAGAQQARRWARAPGRAQGPPGG